MRIKRALAAAITVIAATGLVAGCGDDDSGDAGTSEQTTETTDDAGDSGAGDTDAEGDTEGDTDAGTGGEASVKVDGQDVADLDASTVACAKTNGTIAVTAGDGGVTSGLGVLMTDEDQPSVQSVAIVTDGLSLAVASGSGAEVGSAEVSVDGDTYTITGTAQGTDLDKPTEVLEKDFEIVVTCS